MSLDDLHEQRRSILHVLGEDLQQVAVVVKVDQDLQLLQLKPQSFGFLSQVFTVWKVHQDKHSHCGRTTKTNIHTVEGPPRQDKHSHCERTTKTRQTVTMWKDHQDNHLHCGRTTKTNIYTVEGPPRQTFTLWKDHQDKHLQCGRTTKTNIHSVEGPPRQDKHSQCSVISYAGNDQCLIFHHRTTTTTTNQ